MAFGSMVDSVSATSEYVCIGEWGFAFCAYKGLAVISLASVDVDAPCDFQRVSSVPTWGAGVYMNGAVRSRDSCFMEDVTIDGARIYPRVGVVCLDKFAEAGVEVE